ncbi:MAG: MIP family channel protein [Bacteroidales bacterium]|jgi:aquaporin Z|nr:MIP family channel protein [Bacteroidales bacterium]
MRKYFAEMIGTMVLVLMGCGAAVFAGTPQGFASVGTLGVAFAFGLSVIAMAYTIGKISGCHINPAITLGMLVAKRISPKDAVMYIIFQLIGAIIGSAILCALTCGLSSSTTLTGANGFSEPITASTAFIAEAVFTFIFVLVVLGSTSEGAFGKFAGLAIGLTLVLVHIVCIPITGTSVNPARSFGPAIFEGIAGNIKALEQLWLFIVAPFVGAIVAALVWKVLDKKVTNA